MFKKFPSDIQKYINDAITTEINIGCSETMVYRIDKNNQTLFLKVGHAPLLIKEYASLIFLKGKLAVPECIYFTNDGQYEYLITKAVEGEMSCSDFYLSKPEVTIKLLAFMFFMCNSS